MARNEIENAVDSLVNEQDVHVLKLGGWSVYRERTADGWRYYVTNLGPPKVYLYVRGDADVAANLASNLSRGVIDVQVE
jgi:hypothetical protein